MEILIPKIQLECPTLQTIASDIRANMHELTNSTRAMSIVLEETQYDVDSQFDQKQGEWKPNKPFTVRKKERNHSDMRIMHESRVKGTRLRDAYKKTGEVANGELTYFYPPTHPFAKELQDGVSGNQLANRHKKSEFNSEDDSRLDREFGSIFGVETGSFKDLFKKTRKPRKKKR